MTGSAERVPGRWAHELAAHLLTPLASGAVRGPLGRPLRVGRGRLLDQLRAVVLRRFDPLVTYQLDGFELELPLSHELPRYRAAYPAYGENLGRVARAVAERHPGCGVIDLGANVGDSAACVRAACDAPVLCIEGDDTFFRILSRNAPRIPALTLERALVGAEDTTRPGAIEASRGTGRFQAGGGEARFERLDTILKRHPGFPPPKLVKTDTDGGDLAILSGHLDLWAELRPVLFFEYDPAFAPPEFDPTGFFGSFARLGYARLLAWENDGEYLCSLPVDDAASVRDLHARYEGWKSHRYADLALFHADDGDLAERVGRGEASARRAAAVPRLG